MDESLLRFECLRMAHSKDRKPEDVLTAAQAYFAFVSMAQLAPDADVRRGVVSNTLN